MLQKAIIDRLLHQHLLMVLIVAFLTGCGGAGGGAAAGSTAGTGGVTPVATFTATDTITTQVPASTSSTDVMSFTGSAMVSTIPSTVLIGLDATGLPISATVTGAVSTGAASLTAGAIAYFGSGAASVFRGDLYASMVAATIADPTTGLKYSNFGEWQLLLPASSTGTYNIQEYAGGTQLTPAASMPAMGSGATITEQGYTTAMGFNGNPLQLYGMSVSLSPSITLSFSATNTFSGTIASMTNVANVPAFSGFSAFNSLTMSGTISGNTFAGTITTNADATVNATNPLAMPGGVSGIVSGKFYGPAANEMSGVYMLMTTTTNGPVTIMGSFGAKQ